MTSISPHINNGNDHCKMLLTLANERRLSKLNEKLNYSVNNKKKLYKQRQAQHKLNLVQAALDAKIQLENDKERAEVEGMLARMTAEQQKEEYEAQCRQDEAERKISKNNKLMKKKREICLGVFLQGLHEVSKSEDNQNERRIAQLLKLMRKMGKEKSKVQQRGLQRQRERSALESNRSQKFTSQLSGRLPQQDSIFQSQGEIQVCKRRVNWSSRTERKKTPMKKLGLYDRYD